ncbi:MAG: zinc metallopeptidase [Hyphomicrobiaceae bacterium]
MAFLLIMMAGIAALSYLPGAWVKGVLARHGQERADFAETGGAFARRILSEMKLGHVKVEPTREGDHYDPATRTVRLSPAHYDRRSLAALVVAAHEVGHAMQDATGYKPLRQRTVLAAPAKIERFGSFVMLAAPVLMVVSKSPVVLALNSPARWCSAWACSCICARCRSSTMRASTARCRS